MNIYQALIFAIAITGDIQRMEKAIESGVDINVKGAGGSTVLMHGVMSRKAGMVDILIKAGADVNAQNDEGVTALKLAQNKAEHIENVEFEKMIELLKHAGAME